VLLRARPDAYAASFAALARDVERAAREAARMALVQPAADPRPPEPTGDPEARPGVRGA
jgi:hypothetical protein